MTEEARAEPKELSNGSTLTRRHQPQRVHGPGSPSIRTLRWVDGVVVPTAGVSDDHAAISAKLIAIIMVAPARSSPARLERALLTFIVIIANVAHPGFTCAEPQPKSASAPLDAYFGKLHLSAIVLRHRIDALSARYHSRTISDDDLLHDAKLLESALDVWQEQYPHDSWMLPTIYHLEQLYQAVQTSEARAHATGLLNLLIKTYPDTPQGHLSRLRLRQGFPPLHAETATHATPNPYASPSPKPAPSAT